MTQVSFNSTALRTRGFTLAEMLVAVALVALLTIGIGQVFSNISRLVGTGAAIAQIDQQARAIEKQLRDDFAAAARLSADENFLVIRCRESALPVYATREQRETDLRRGLTRVGANSQARVRRLDELSIMAFAGESGTFSSYQLNGPVGGDTVRSLYARLYYGHGLRPAPDLEYDPDEDRVPQRLFVPDGDFGSEPGDNNIFDPTNQSSSGRVGPWGRNVFASDWIMVRQPLLMYGGLAAGTLSDDEAVIGNDREFAPYIRDVETQQRFGAAVGNDEPNGGTSPNDRSNPRLLRHGRVDICAQSFDDAVRWLEGRDPQSGGQPNINNLPDATAYSSGFLNNTVGTLAVNDVSEPDSPLYARSVQTGNPRLTELVNRSKVQSAVAGVMQRVLCDNVTPVIDRGGSDSILNPEDSLMDLHASFATNCSSMEIAWSDGTTAIDEIDFNGDGSIDFARGDIVWFDMNFTREDLTRIDPQNYRPFDDHLEAELDHDRTRLVIGFDGDPRVEPSGANANFIGYDWFLTGGTQDAQDEYLAVWPFRRPAGDGGYTGAWIKPELVRFRMTLHDSLGRIPEGKTFEFIYSLIPSAS